MLKYPSGPIPRDEWLKEHECAARAVALKVLGGVREESTDKEESGIVTLVIRRQCKDEERKLVLERYAQGPAA